MSGSVAFFAAHEARLAWRDALAMLAGVRTASRRRTVLALAGLATFIAVLHLVAEAVVGPLARAGALSAHDKTTLAGVTGAAFMALMLMLSQALETTTRAFYARADLDLILSSPASSARLFAVRIGAIALSASLLASFIAGPFINILALHDGPHWLAAYAALWALATLAAALAVMGAVVLFRLIGPKRTRTVTQVVAALIGAAFVIGVQVVSILSYGQFARAAPAAAHLVLTLAPEPLQAPAGLVYTPARAALGDLSALTGLVALAAAALITAVRLAAPRFGAYALATVSLGEGGGAATKARALSVAASPTLALMRKEWRLILRDPWLMSQTLMQILYLLPPALLLWRNFGEGGAGVIVVVPVLVMAAGQLAGGLAWLALSAEDAPDLVASAPVPPGLVTTAKVAAVLTAVAALVGPLALVLTLIAPFAGAATLAGLVLAAAAATLVQLMFRTTARRAQFRRRQTASRVATLLEAFASIGVAGAAALVAAQTWLALVPLALVAAMLGLTRLATGRGRD